MAAKHTTIIQGKVMTGAVSGSNSTDNFTYALRRADFRGSDLWKVISRKRICVINVSWCPHQKQFFKGF